MQRICRLLVGILFLQGCILYANANQGRVHLNSFLCLLLVVAMCWGGVEGATWILRRSPFCSQSKNIGDWQFLWLQLGIPGAVWGISGLGTCWLLSKCIKSALIGLGAEQFYLGCLIWLVLFPFLGGPLVLREAIPLVKRLLWGGLVGQLLCLGMYLWVYPAPFEFFSLLNVTASARASDLAPIWLRIRFNRLIRPSISIYSILRFWGGSDGLGYVYQLVRCDKLP